MKVINKVLSLFIVLSIGFASYAQTVHNDQTNRKKVVQVLQQFQDGYSKRDTTIIDEFLKMFSDDIVYMGIASHEFFKGKESVRKLTLWDWKHWFDLKIPIEKLDVRVDNEVAWFEIIGVSGPWRDGKKYEIRMVGSLIKSKDKWLFKQVCFSYPVPLKEVE
jgi:ketosteroid isomerase-like protein